MGIPKDKGTRLTPCPLWNVVGDTWIEHVTPAV